MAIKMTHIFTSGSSDFVSEFGEGTLTNLVVSSNTEFEGTALWQVIEDVFAVNWVCAFGPVRFSILVFNDVASDLFATIVLWCIPAEADATILWFDIQVNWFGRNI